MNNPTNQPDSQAGDDIETILLNRVVIIGDSQTTYKGTPAELTKELADYAERLATERAVAEQEQLRWLLCRKAEKNGSWTMDGLELMKASNKRTSELSARLTGEAK